MDITNQALPDGHILVITGPQGTGKMLHAQAIADRRGGGLHIVDPHDVTMRFSQTVHRSARTVIVDGRVDPGRFYVIDRLVRTHAKLSVVICCQPEDAPAMSCASAPVIHLKLEEPAHG